MWLAGSIIVATWPLSGLGIKPCFRFPKAGLVLPYSRDGCGPVFQMKRRCGLTRSSQASTLCVACPPSVRLGRVKLFGSAPKGFRAESEGPASLPCCSPLSLKSNSGKPDPVHQHVGSWSGGLGVSSSLPVCLLTVQDRQPLERAFSANRP